MVILTTKSTRAMEYYLVHTLRVDVRMIFRLRGGTLLL